jgi:hypothetical protein
MEGGKAVYRAKGQWACSQPVWNARRSSLNSGGPWPSPKLAQTRVLGIQRKLHKWSIDDQDRRFDHLHNLACDPATLMVAWLRVRATEGHARLLWTGRPPATSSRCSACRRSLTGSVRSRVQGASGRCRSGRGDPSGRLAIPLLLLSRLSRQLCASARPEACQRPQLPRHTTEQRSRRGESVPPAPHAPA